jgi:autophagy-related protein 18
MNLAQGSETCGELLGVNFNQDCTSIAVGTHSGYKLYEFTSVDRLNKLHEMLGGDACIVERLFSSSLVAVVGSKQRTKLRVYHFKKETEICNYSYSNKILNVKLNRQRLIVVLEDNLFIHSIKDMKACIVIWIFSLSALCSIFVLPHRSSTPSETLLLILQVQFNRVH